MGFMGMYCLKGRRSMNLTGRYGILNVNITPFERATGPTTVLPAKAKAGESVRLVYPDNLLDLIVGTW